LRCFFFTRFWWRWKRRGGDDGDGVGRLLASAFRSSWILFFRFCFLLGSIYRPAFFEVCIGSLLVRHRHVTM
jgi:hypothetical protein